MVNEATAKARRSEALYRSSNAGISRRWLCDKVAELEHELEQLRKQERDAEHEESVAWDRVRKVERENAELRELLLDVWNDALEFDGFWNYVYDDGKIYNEDELPHYRERMRELGIEVPQ